MAKKIAFLIILSLLYGIAGYAQENGGKEIKRGPFSVMLPQNWRLPWLEQPKRTRNVANVIITKDGVSLNKIELKSRPITTPFDHTRKKLEQGMQPFEMAELVLDDMQLNTAMKNFTVQENKPVTVCGRPGFRAVFSYTDNGTLQYKAVCYGFQQEKYFYTIQYEAPVIHYFDMYLPVFERIAGSVTIN